jgi:hypothetical protein
MSSNRGRHFSSFSNINQYDFHNSTYRRDRDEQAGGDSRRDLPTSSNRYTRFQTPRIYGDITLEMIDDFFNTKTKKPEESKHKLEFFLSSSQSGHGMPSKEMHDNQLEINCDFNNNRFMSDKRSHLSVQEEERMEFSYISLRKEYENELKSGIYESTHHEHSVIQFLINFFSKLN